MGAYDAYKISAFTTTVSEQAERPVLGAAALQAVFDAAAEQLRIAYNDALDKLSADKALIDAWKAEMVNLLTGDQAANISALLLAHAFRHATGGADAITPESIGAEKEALSFSDTSVTTSSWSTFTPAAGEETKIYNRGYTHRKSIASASILSSMTVIGIPSDDINDCGTSICATMITYDGGFRIYAKAAPSNAFTFLVLRFLKAGG